ncbi:hypothetical protein ABZ543_35015 [Streptomyces roseifaciens]
MPRCLSTLTATAHADSVTGTVDSLPSTVAGTVGGLTEQLNNTLNGLLGGNS